MSKENEMQPLGRYEEGGLVERREELRRASYEEYRRCMDEATDDFRKVGIQDADSYYKICQDERTIYRTYRGMQMPVFAPIDHEKMYNQDRCMQMLDSKQIFLLSLPIDSLWDESAVAQLPDESAILVEEFVSPDSSPAGAEHALPAHSNLELTAYDFKNPELMGMPDNETAWMAAYTLDISPAASSAKEFDSDSYSFRNEAIAIWRQYCQENSRELEPPEEGADGTYILTAEELTRRPEIIDAMWEISEHGFGKILGAHHPVSMEFNRDFFDSQVKSPNSFTTIRYVDGEAVCFGFLGLDMDNNDWLNTDSTPMQAQMRSAQEAGRPMVHFYEIISKGERGVGYSTDILDTFLLIASMTNYRYRVFFESTNLSALYIPQTAEKLASQSPHVRLDSPSRMLGKLSYWAVKVKKLDDIIE